MNRALLRKCIAESQWLLLFSGLLLFGFCWLRVWIVTQFEMPRFAAVVEQFWDKWGHVSPVSFQQLVSFPGRIALTYVEPVVVFTVSVWSIARGSDVVSGELGRGTMEMLLAQPLSRLQVLLTHAAVTIAGIALLSLFCWAGTWTGIHTNTVEVEPPASRIKVPLLNLELPIPLVEQKPQRVPMSDVAAAREFAPAAFNLFSLGFCVAGLATLLSSCDRYRWRTIGLVAGIILVQFIIKGFAVAAPTLNWLKRFTLFTAYEPQLFVAVAVDHPASTWSLVMRDELGRIVQLGPLGYCAVLLAIGLVSYCCALIIFCRRDLPAPL